MMVPHPEDGSSLIIMRHLSDPHSLLRTHYCSARNSAVSSIHLLMWGEPRGVEGGKKNVGRGVAKPSFNNILLFGPG